MPPLQHSPGRGGRRAHPCCASLASADPQEQGSRPALGASPAARAPQLRCELHPAPQGRPTRAAAPAPLGWQSCTHSCLGERGGRLVTSLSPSSSSEREEGPTQTRCWSWESLCLPQTTPKGREPPPPGAGDISAGGTLPAPRRGCHHLPRCKPGGRRALAEKHRAGSAERPHAAAREGQPRSGQQRITARPRQARAAGLGTHALKGARGEHAEATGSTPRPRGKATVRPSRRSPHPAQAARAQKPGGSTCWVTGMPGRRCSLFFCTSASSILHSTFAVNHFLFRLTAEGL